MFFEFVLAGADVWPDYRALRAMAIAMVAGVLGIGYLVSHRVRPSAWQMLAVLSAASLLGAIEGTLELLAGRL